MAHPPLRRFDLMREPTRDPKAAITMFMGYRNETYRSYPSVYLAPNRTIRMNGRAPVVDGVHYIHGDRLSYTKETRAEARVVAEQNGAEQNSAIFFSEMLSIILGKPVVVEHVIPQPGWAGNPIPAYGVRYVEAPEGTLFTEDSS